MSAPAPVDPAAQNSGANNNAANMDKAKKFAEKHGIVAKIKAMVMKKLGINKMV